VRYAFLGDIHGNTEALGQILAHLAGNKIDKIVCLGDIVGYGAEPVQCLEMIRGLGCDVIAGNHDWAAVGKISIDCFNAYAKAAALAAVAAAFVTGHLAAQAGWTLVIVPALHLYQADDALQGLADPIGPFWFLGAVAHAGLAGAGWILLGLALFRDHDLP
jgi:hypothetical protein